MPSTVSVTPAPRIGQEFTLGEYAVSTKANTPAITPATINPQLKIRMLPSSWAALAVPRSLLSAFDLPRFVAVNVEANGQPLQRYHNHDAALVRTDRLVAGIARSSVAARLSEAGRTFQW